MVVKPGSRKEGGVDGPFEIIWRDTEMNVKARYVNEEKFFATFLLKTFPDADTFANRIAEG